MPILTIGRAKVAYDLRRSSTGAERRITVSPGHIEVMALARDSDDDIANFLERKRQWLFNTMRDMERIAADRHSVPRFMTGSKIPFRGRKMSLTVRRSDSSRFLVVYRNGFVVDLPSWVSDDHQTLVASELKYWLKQRARRDVNAMVTSYSKRFGLIPRSVRVADFTGGWGSCGPQGNILINWQLIFAPKMVLDYVVAHELAHLKHRSHGDEFWAYLGSITPDYRRSKAWLDQHGGDLSADFLSGDGA